MSKNINYIFTFIFALLLVQLTSIISGDRPSTVEIRKMTPPSISQSHLGQEIICYRPVRKGGPKLAIENIEGKWVVHNYGHGGGGWSLGPGSANYVINLLENTQAAHTDKNTPITILGAGAIGLFTAYTLVDRGYQHITIIADKYENLTSHNAGAIFSPGTGVKTQDQAFKDLLFKIGFNSLQFYQTIAKKQHPFFTEGVRQMPQYFQTKRPIDLDAYVGELMHAAKEVVVDFGNGKTQAMVVYDDAIFIDTGKMMQLLKDHLNGNVKFENRKINNFSEIKDEIIFNCAGLGAKDLSGDEALMSVQGHLILLKGQQAQDLQQLMLVDTNPDKTKNQHDQDVMRMLYILPKHLPGATDDEIGVIGGTYIEGATSQTPNEEEFALMVQRAREFYGESSLK